jgi:threonine dehydrogenase-like Zn-dependent dehydrogenase
MLAVHIAQGKARVIDTPKPRPRRGFALLKMRVAGICNTDLELLRGYYGFSGIPGHEFVADVVACEDSAWIGKRVVGEINLACRKCSWCKRGLGRHCPRRTVLGIVKHPGAFAEFLTLPVANLLAVPKQIPDHLAVFTEPLAAACEILEQVKFAAGAEVAVLGDGKLGLLIAQVLSLSGLPVTLYGRTREKLDIVKPLGITTAWVSRKSPKVPQAAYRYVVDATGSAAGFTMAAGMVGPRGTLVMKSTVNGRTPVDFAPLIVNEITLVGSRCGPFREALKLLKANALQLEAMLSGEFPLEDAPTALDLAASPGVLKILLRSMT